MNTIPCSLCGNTIRSWWKTVLHPGCPLYRAWSFERSPWTAPPIRRSEP